MKLLVLNGPNINLLGMREPELYGQETYDELVARVKAHCAAHDVEVVCVQSNHEGELVDRIQRAYGNVDGIVFNPAAYTHTSVALLDALLAVGIPTVEVHLSDVAAREAFRQVSYVRRACLAMISGRGVQGYLDAIDLLLAHLGA